MGKNPSFPFYPGDWTRDLDDLDIQIEGAWIRIVCRLWWASPRGTMTKSIKEWSRILRKTNKKTTEILKILIEKGVADGSLLDNQNITITSRRMVKAQQISQTRQRVGRLGGNPNLTKNENNLDNQKPNQKRLPSSSFSNKDIYIVEIIEYLNEKSGKKFSPKTKATASHINARLSEGRTVEDFKRVIDTKVPQWINDPNMQKYIRPETLFGTKFESYLNEEPGKPKEKGWI